MQYALNHFIRSLLSCVKDCVIFLNKHDRVKVIAAPPLLFNVLQNDTTNPLEYGLLKFAMVLLPIELLHQRQILVSFEALSDIVYVSLEFEDSAFPKLFHAEIS